MTSWRHLSEELDAWAEAGRSASLWWRDDDAVEPSPALARLLTLASARDLPLALAVIPARASEALAEWLNTMAVRLYRLGSYDEAEPLYTRSLTIQQKRTISTVLTIRAKSQIIAPTAINTLINKFTIATPQTINSITIIH